MTRLAPVLLELIALRLSEAFGNGEELAAAEVLLGVPRSSIPPGSRQVTSRKC